MTVVNLSFADYGSEQKPFGEIGTVSFSGVFLTAANFDAQNVLIADVVNAIKGVSIGKLVGDVRQLPLTPDIGPATSALSQRENKWLVYMHDTTNHKPHKMLIPCADLMQLMPNSETLDITTALSPGAELKAAIEAYCHPLEYPAHNLIVDKVVFVPRNG